MVPVTLHKGALTGLPWTFQTCAQAYRDTCKCPPSGVLKINYEKRRHVVLQNIIKRTQASLTCWAPHLFSLGVRGEGWLVSRKNSVYGSATLVYDVLQLLPASLLLLISRSALLNISNHPVPTKRHTDPPTHTPLLLSAQGMQTHFNIDVGTIPLGRQISWQKLI